MTKQNEGRSPFTVKDAISLEISKGTPNADVSAFMTSQADRLEMIATIGNKLDNRAADTTLGAMSFKDKASKILLACRDLARDQQAARFAGYMKTVWRKEVKEDGTEELHNVTADHINKFRPEGGLTLQTAKNLHADGFILKGLDKKNVPVVFTPPEELKTEFFPYKEAVGQFTLALNNAGLGTEEYAIAALDYCENVLGIAKTKVGMFALEIRYVPAEQKKASAPKVQRKVNDITF